MFYHIMLYIEPHDLCTAFQEREENVRLDVLQCFTRLLKVGGLVFETMCYY